METRGLGAGSYPEPPEEKETNLQIYITITTSDLFPKEWDEKEIESYVKANINEYVTGCDTEVNEINIWR